MEVIEVIKQCSADGNVLRLPKMEWNRHCNNIDNSRKMKVVLSEVC